MKVYLLVLNVIQLDPEIMRRKFAMMPELTDWLWFFSHAAGVKSFADAPIVGQAFHSHFPGLQFMVQKSRRSRAKAGCLK